MFLYGWVERQDLTPQAWRPWLWLWQGLDATGITGMEGQTQSRWELEEIQGKVGCTGIFLGRKSWFSRLICSNCKNDHYLHSYSCGCSQKVANLSNGCQISVFEWWPQGGGKCVLATRVWGAPFNKQGMQAKEGIIWAKTSPQSMVPMNRQVFPCFKFQKMCIKC